MVREKKNDLLIQLNLSTTGTFQTGESDLCKEMAAMER